MYWKYAIPLRPRRAGANRNILWNEALWESRILTAPGICLSHEGALSPSRLQLGIIKLSKRIPITKCSKFKRFKKTFKINVFTKVICLQRNKISVNKFLNVMRNQLIHSAKLIKKHIFQLLIIKNS